MKQILQEFFLVFFAAQAIFWLGGLGLRKLADRRTAKYLNVAERASS